ncbi:glycosyltransferase [Arthrobacter sp. AQ5-05]|uniref:glycosyltransferase n=1 Tax=Arthrobacter sp. AQ5-05 TaxID=2184581 RepID=UPI0012B56D36|nr:glycosyltransferase [Arthrobacter sp. AQ5-05]
MNAEFHDIPATVRVSVCMATYRGAAFVAEQIESILTQLAPTDELVIVDDASPDNTVEIIKALDDRRIKLHEATKNQGYVRSFGQAVKESRGEYIFLADQDDLWLPGRLERMLSALGDADVVASNFGVLGGGDRGRVPSLKASDSTHHVRNIVGIIVGYRPYYGCGMAMTRAQAEVFLPIPSFLPESHDLWLGLCGNVGGSIVHLDEATLLRRLHENNVTPRGWRSLGTILKARIMILRALAEAIRRAKSQNATY